MFCVEGDSIAVNLSSLHNQSNTGDFVSAFSYDPNYNETGTPKATINVIFGEFTKCTTVLFILKKSTLSDSL
jgi:hypothetical protein